MFGDEPVFLGGCPVIKPHDGIYVEGHRVIALAGISEEQSNEKRAMVIYALMLGMPVVGAAIGARKSKIHPVVGGVTGFAAGMGGAILATMAMGAIFGRS